MIIRDVSLVKGLLRFMFSKAWCSGLDIPPDVVGGWIFVMVPDSVVTCIVLGKNFMLPPGLCQTAIAPAQNCMCDRRALGAFYLSPLIGNTLNHMLMQELCFKRYRWNRTLHMGWFDEQRSKAAVSQHVSVFMYFVVSEIGIFCVQVFAKKQNHTLG